mmetsp:Transcript_109177/g.216772  ORF Transcript_109177/g.216772 Transcript_109177/m.216772 type:complete len:327 (+) Transcript_109177:92-1072(+)
MKKTPKIKTKASKEAMRWGADDGSTSAELAQQPGLGGNDFDVLMQHEADGVLAAKKIVAKLKERGVCLCQANAPQQLVVAAYDEAESLWEEGNFVPPLRVHDDASLLESRLWRPALQDEDRVYWVKGSPEGGEATAGTAALATNALRLLAGNLKDFGAGLNDQLQSQLGLSFNRLGQTMLSCYTGDRTYALHLDNCHGSEDEDGGSVLPDNGLRLTLVYYINLYWDPETGYNGGGLDVHLTDPSKTPESAAAARGTRALRIAPHADTLAIFLSDRMAHRVVETKGTDPRFCLTLWCLDGEIMQKAARTLNTMRVAQRQTDDSDAED